MNRLTLHDVAHRERRPDDARVRQGRLEDRGADDPGDSQLVHDVGDEAGRVGDALESLDQILRRP